MFNKGVFTEVYLKLIDYGYCYIIKEKEKDNIKSFYLDPTIRIIQQESIDKIQQAFNKMQKDLAILKEIEKDELEL